MSDIQFTRVTSVSVQDGEVFVSCQPPRPGVEYREIPMLQLFPGAMTTPSEGDIIAVHNLPDGTKVATMASSPPDGVTMPDLGEGEMCFRFDDDTEIRIVKNGDGYDTYVSASGKVYLGDQNGTMKPVARQGDPISGTDSSGGAVSGQIESGSSNVESS